jgi:hypothetical protein
MAKHEVDQHAPHQAPHQVMSITQLRAHPLRMLGKEKQLMALIHALKRHPLLTYFVLVFVLSWACWIPLAISKTWASFRLLS